MNLFLLHRLACWLSFSHHIVGSVTRRFVECVWSVNLNLLGICGNSERKSLQVRHEKKHELFLQCFEVLFHLFSFRLWGSKSSLFQLCHKHSRLLMWKPTHGTKAHTHKHAFTQKCNCTNYTWLSIRMDESLIWWFVNSFDGCVSLDVLRQTFLFLTGLSCQMTVVSSYGKLHPCNLKHCGALFWDIHCHSSTVKDYNWAFIVCISECLFLFLKQPVA